LVATAGQLITVQDNDKGLFTRKVKAFCFMETASEKLNRWYKEQKRKAQNNNLEKIRKIPYGLKISKRRFFNDLYDLEPHEKVIYIRLGLYQDREGHCWPSMRVLADDLNLNKNTIQKYIRKLEKKGFIKIDKKRGKRGKRFDYWLLK
jgi:DNA-binding MarR family transcriptional regulator